jgi:NAD+ synthase
MTQSYTGVGADALNIVLIQDNPTAGDLSGNAGKILKKIQEHPNADLLIFPEAFLTGYPIGDLVTRPGFLAKVDDHINALRADVSSANGPAILFGAPRAGVNLPYNAAYLIEPHGPMQVISKTELPNNDVFDERRTFQSGKIEGVRPMSFKGYQLGVQICEDIWHGRVSRALADEVADVLIALNGSPYARGKQDIRVKHASARARDTGLPLIYLNMVGGQDELVFDGGSFIMNEPGVYLEAPAFECADMRIRLYRDKTGSAHFALNDIVDNCYSEDHMQNDYRAVLTGLRDYLIKTGMKKVFVGVSGGLDSALVLTMAVDALGADAVTGVMMPTRHTSQESKDLAQDLMTRLGVHQLTIDLENEFSLAGGSAILNAKVLAEKHGIESNIGIMQENLQSRLRAVHLMALSNALGGIVLSTGNKSEMSVGYATLYGDMCGGFNPMKSIYKSRAFEMAAWRNDQFIWDKLGPNVIIDPIPERIITRPPSAELADDQSDEAALGSYDLLDCVLEAIIEKSFGVLQTADLIKSKWSLEELEHMAGGRSPEEYCERIAHLVRISQYKRDQSPPGVKLNDTDFGLGWRYPIAGIYAL